MMISEQLPLRCQIVWNYFGVGVLLKRELCEEQLKPQGLKTQDAKEAINFLQLEINKFHATHPNA